VRWPHASVPAQRAAATKRALVVLGIACGIDPGRGSAHRSNASDSKAGKRLKSHPLRHLA